MKRLFMALLVLVMFISCFSIGVGHYMFNYVLNPNSDKNISEKIKTNKNINNQKWLDNNSERISIMSDDQLKLNGYFVKNDSHDYMILVHGFLSDASSVVGVAKEMKDDMNLLLVDLRAHGKSEGQYIGMGWLDSFDILNWIDYIVSQDAQARIVLYGISMGGSTVLNVSGYNPDHVKVIIEDCGFTSAWDIFFTQLEEYGKLKDFILYSSAFMTYIEAGYNLKDASSIKQVEKTHIPILFIHGKKDDFVPVEMVYQLYEHTYSDKQLFIVEEANHADSDSVDPKLYNQAIKSFIYEHLG